jgi:transcription antitermination protein NusB
MSEANANSNAPLARSQARLAAVQALYQMDLAGTDLTDVIDEFRTHRIGPDAEDRTIAGADAEYFARILHGAVAQQRDLDPVIDGQLATGWRLVRVDAILRAILRAGAFELKEEPDVPPRVVINEYVNVAHAFFAGDEPRVVNGVLDALARKLRPGALPERS